MNKKTRIFVYGFFLFLLGATSSVLVLQEMYKTDNYTNIGMWVILILDIGTAWLGIRKINKVT